MGPDLVTTLGFAMGSAWLSGINLYATVVTLGLLQRYHLAHLPGSLDFMQQWWVIVLAGALYLIEFVADKIPAVDSIWDAIHTFIRIPIGAMLAWGAIGDASPETQFVAAILGGAITGGTHLMKAGTRAANVKKNLEPEVGVDIDVVNSAEETVRDSDLVVTATTAQQPILKSEWLKPGAHVNAVGSHRPDSREIDGPTVARSKVVVDSREAIMAECGDILLAIKDKNITENHLHAEIGEVLVGTKSGRSNASEVTLYKSVGIAIQDVATAQLVYRKALELKVGTNVEV